MTAAVATAGVAMLISPHAYCSAAVISSRRSGSPPVPPVTVREMRGDRNGLRPPTAPLLISAAGGSTEKHRERRRRSSEISGRTRNAVAPFKYTSSGVSRGRSPPPERVDNQPKKQEREQRVPSLRQDKSPLIPNTFSAAKLFRCQRRELTPLADGVYIPYVTL